MVLPLIYIILIKINNELFQNNDSLIKINNELFQNNNHLMVYQSINQTIKLLLQYTDIHQLNKFKKNIIYLLTTRKITLRQIMYCLIKEDYEMNYINNYDKESWNYKTDLIYIKFRIYTDASKFWYYNNMLHNDDIDENNKLMPAIIDEYGDNYYYINDILLKY